MDFKGARKVGKTEAGAPMPAPPRKSVFPNKYISIGFLVIRGGVHTGALSPDPINFPKFSCLGNVCVFCNGLLLSLFFQKVLF